jgi:hypothetical protein
MRYAVSKGPGSTKKLDHEISPTELFSARHLSTLLTSNGVLLPA